MKAKPRLLTVLFAPLVAVDLFYLLLGFASLLQAVGDTLEPTQVSLWLRQGDLPEVRSEG
jgi:hypothetical protein